MLFPSTKLQDLCLVGVFGGGTKQWLETMAETATLCNKQTGDLTVLEMVV